MRDTSEEPPHCSEYQAHFKEDFPETGRAHETQVTECQIANKQGNHEDSRNDFIITISEEHDKNYPCTMKIYMNKKIKAGKKYSKMIKVTALGCQVKGVLFAAILQVYFSFLKRQAFYTILNIRQYTQQEKHQNINSNLASILIVIMFLGNLLHVFRVKDAEL